LTFVYLLGRGEPTKRCVPVSLEVGGDETIVRINGKVAAPGLLGSVAGALHVLATQCISLDGASFELALDCEGDVERDRRDRLEQRRADRGVKGFARHRLAG
jgi:hypothetical protein